MVAVTGGRSRSLRVCRLGQVRVMASVADPATASIKASAGVRAKPPKLHGRAFYESIGSPKHIIAPMVDQSEFVRRLKNSPSPVAHE
jgi:hypothetical protein